MSLALKTSKSQASQGSRESFGHILEEGSLESSKVIANVLFTARFSTLFLASIHRPLRLLVYARCSVCFQRYTVLGLAPVHLEFWILCALWGRPLAVPHWLRLLPSALPRWLVPSESLPCE